MYACISKHARQGRLGACSPRKFLEIRCSEIASEDILGRKQSCCSYMAHGVLHPTFDCPCGDSLSQLTLNFHERRYDGWENSRWGEIARRAPEITIYLCMYLCMPFHHCDVNSLCTCSALSSMNEPA